MGYLTPSYIPASDTCRVLFIPDSPEYLAIVRGALQLLTLPVEWTTYGPITPEQAAASMLPMFNRFCFNEGTCRVIGEIIAFAGSVSPDANWLPCDGASLLRADYSDLFNVIGTTYGAADADHFNVPDLRGRAISGEGTGSGLNPVAVGQAYGEQDHVLTEAELASHTHTDAGHDHTTGNSTTGLQDIPVGVTPVLLPNPIPATTGVGYADISTTGGDAAHNTVGPRLGMLYLIVARTDA